MCVEIVGAKLIRARFGNIRGECSINALWPPSQSESVVMVQLSMLPVLCQCIGLTIFPFLQASLVRGCSTMLYESHTVRTKRETQHMEMHCAVV